MWDPGADDTSSDEIDSDRDGLGTAAEAALNGIEHLDLQEAFDAPADGEEVLVRPSTTRKIST